MELGHLGLGDFDCELVIVVSELSLESVERKKHLNPLIFHSLPF